MIDRNRFTEQAWNAIALSTRTANELGHNYVGTEHLLVGLLLEEEGVAMAAAEVTMIPQTYVELSSEEDIKNIQKTLDLLEEDDDVQDVYHNWDE